VETSDFYKEPFLLKKDKKTNPPVIAKSDAPVTTTKPKATTPVKKPVAKNASVAKVGSAKPKATPVKTPVTTKGSVAKTGTGSKTNTLSTTTASIKPKTPANTKQNAVAKGNVNKPVQSSTTLHKAGVNTELAKGTDPKSTKIESPSTDVGKRVQALVVPKPLTTRTNEVVKTLTVNTNEVIVNVYDNGTIDHDTISIYVDKRLVVSRQMLTTSPITVKLNFDDNEDYHELIMVAENLGDIPPNTSLMVVKAGSKEYEVRITSTEQKNALVIFKYEK